jgi:hypothetical protein
MNTDDEPIGEIVEWNINPPTNIADMRDQIAMLREEVARQSEIIKTAVDLLAAIQTEVGPMVEALGSSPVLKLLGVKKP